MEETGLLVIGAGPCGLAAGIAAKQAGISCVLVDRRTVVSTIDRYPLAMTFFSTPERIEIGGVPFIASHEKPTRQDGMLYYRRVAEHYDLDVRPMEEVTAVTREPDGRYRIEITRPHDRKTYLAEAVVFATGYYDNPNYMNVPGEELPHVSHYFVEGHPYWHRRVIVIGAGNSSVDAALECWRAGAVVTLVHARAAGRARPGQRAELARRLSAHPAVAEVRHPSLPTDAGHERAARAHGRLRRRSSALRPVGGAAGADAVVAALQLWVPATSLGGVESTLERRRRFATESATVPEDLVRLSVGIEDVEDLWADLDRALRAPEALGLVRPARARAANQAPRPCAAAPAARQLPRGSALVQHRDDGDRHLDAQRRAPARARTGSDFTPSAVPPVAAIASSRVMPRPMWPPSVWLRESGDAQVAMRSPSPARPGNVSASAPSASPSRVISTRPRVMTVAIVL